RGARRRVPMGPRYPGGSGGRERRDRTQALPAARRLVRFLDQRKARRWQGCHTPGRPRYHPPLCARRSDCTDGAGETVYRREGGWPPRHFRLSRRGWLFPALRRRRWFLQLSKRRVDGHTDVLERCPQRADPAPRRRLQNVAARETGPACEARRIQQVRGIRRQTSGDTILTAIAAATASFRV